MSKYDPTLPAGAAQLPELAQCVYATVKQIPLGSVATYKLVAQRCKIKNPRQVGAILHRNPWPELVPCHRVVRSDGRIASGYAFGGTKSQATRLKEEGIAVTNGRLALEHYLWLTDKTH